MKCPNCGYTDSKVTDSRPNDDHTSIRRRRECQSCQKRFTTYEIIDTIPISVIKKNGTKELFDRNKILAGIMKACDKRSVTREQMERLVMDIETELQNSLDTEFSSKHIGVMVMDRLKALDEVAYVRFASVHREFKDLQTFMQALEEMTRTKESDKNC
ncbi:MAG: transcriptional repressor NrdR [Clostridia bacterium]|nr:transcriptional repressor NrdR [Clostridia bacterium]